MAAINAAEAKKRETPDIIKSSSKKVNTGHVLPAKLPKEKLSAAGGGGLRQPQKPVGPLVKITDAAATSPIRPQPYRPLAGPQPQFPVGNMAGFVYLIAVY